jgi:alpha-dioxygenase
MPVLIGLLYLNTRRTLLEKYNLLAVGSSHGTLSDPKKFLYRTEDGKYNDPDNAEAGSQYTFFGRNMKPVDQEHEVLNYTLFTIFFSFHTKLHILCSNNTS